MALAKFIISLLIFASSLIIIILTSFILNLAKRIASFTKTDLDDKIIDSLKSPVKFSLLIFGIYGAVYYYNKSLTIGNFGIETILKSFLVLVGAYLLLNITNVFLDEYINKFAKKTKSKIDDNLFPFIKKIISFLILAIALIIILGMFGIEIGPLLASLGIAGLAVALALQDTLSNFFAAVYIAADRPVKIGDYVELEGGIKGFIKEIGWRSTKIRTLPNNEIIIPNSKLSQTTIINYNSPKPEMSLVIPVGVSYESDLDKVEKITIKVAKKILKETKGAVKEFEPFVRYNEFADSSINFSVILKINSYVDQYLLKHQFIKLLKKEFDKQKIEIPFPQRDIHMK